MLSGLHYREKMAKFRCRAVFGDGEDDKHRFAN